MHTYHTPHRFTYSDYEKLEEGAPVQLIRGELVNWPSATPRHQAVSGTILCELYQYVRARSLGTILAAPIDVFLSDLETYQPDIIFIAEERREIIGSRKIEGAPDLVIEILSPSTAYYDMKQKKQTYEYSGVREYWIVDPIEMAVEIYELRDDIFIFTQYRAGTGTLHSHVVEGFSISAETIFRTM